MKKTMKLIAILTIMTVLIGLVTLAVADDKIYTSPTFKLPKSRIVQPEPEAEPEVTEEPGTVPEETEEPGTEPEGTEPEGTEEPGTEPESTEPEGTEPEGTEESGTEPEGTEPEEPAPVERKVMIYSTRKDVVTEGDIIELTGALIGFDDVPDEAIHVQWEVDRNDGAGWVAVEGATKWYYKFIANKETILYNWRLTVTVSE